MKNLRKKPQKNKMKKKNKKKQKIKKLQKLCLIKFLKEDETITKKMNKMNS